MNQQEYDAIKCAGSGRSFCDTCLAETDFTHNESGEMFCVSCGGPVEVEDEQRWTNHYFHCGKMWDDVWSCQCNDECPVCHAKIEPYASTDNSDGGLQIHAQDVYNTVLEHAAIIKMIHKSYMEGNS